MDQDINDKSTTSPTADEMPDELPASATLQAGYIRLVRILHSRRSYRRELGNERPYREDLSNAHRMRSAGDWVLDSLPRRDGQYYLKNKALVVACQTCIRRSKPQPIRAVYGEYSGSLGRQSYRWGDPRPTWPDSGGNFEYTALSYAWGDPTPRYQITIDGQSRMIAENLWLFLLRASFDPCLEDRWLWIDALSIDQSNPEERRHQIGIMSQIFHDAAGVIIWLGPAFDGSDEAMKFLGGHSGSREVAQDNSRLEFVSKSIGDLCALPYWHRLWVFQEIKLARCITVLCGDDEVSGADFGALFDGTIPLYDLLDPKTAFSLKFNSPAGRMVRLCRKMMSSSLWNLLRETRHLVCEDRRDKVYALLGVATCGAADIEADYLIDLEDLGRLVLHPLLDNELFARYGYSMECSFLSSVLGVKIECPRKDIRTANPAPPWLIEKILVPRDGSP
jgi:hypothetical protein